MSIAVAPVVISNAGLFPVTECLFRRGLLARAVAGSRDQWIGAMATRMLARRLSVRCNVLVYGIVLVTPMAAGGQPMWSTAVGQMEPVTSAILSLDGKLLAAASEDGAVYLLDPVTRDEITKLDGHSKRGNSVAFSLDSAHVVSEGDDFIQLRGLCI